MKMTSFNGKYFCATLIVWLSTLESCRSIMVEFGTSKGPILPKEPVKIANAQTKIVVARSPAPVQEFQEDIPNPNNYQPPIPHQYRTKLYSFKPNPNLILGTPLDQFYTPSVEKYELNRKQYSRHLGPEYTGPHTFEKQDYQVQGQKKTTLLPSVRYTHQELSHRSKPDQQQKYVPQIGIVYSGGVRYYVPHIFYFTPNGQAGVEENSVYDKNDEKYLVRQQ
ncbi:hypothetical protein ABEB36_008054 [Hypothenemus hampei]|uniref:Uncharacterized protein n=1 Tax=Hypothenemus hampei TaxID=57062 RepID=A0ABD1EMQ0_HYPHA